MHHARPVSAAAPDSCATAATGPTIVPWPPVLHREHIHRRRALAFSQRGEMQFIRGIGLWRMCGLCAPCKPPPQSGTLLRPAYLCYCNFHLSRVGAEYGRLQSIGE